MGGVRILDYPYLGLVPIRTGFGLFGRKGQIQVVRCLDKVIILWTTRVGSAVVKLIA